MLAEIEYVTVGVVNLEYSGHVLQHQGFGHLVPSSEPSNVLGVVYDSCAFPDHDRPGEPTTRLTCMMGGAWFRQLFGEPSTVSTARLEQTALDAVREQLGVQTEPRRVRVTVQEDCIPQYRVGHSKLLQNIQSELINQELPLHLIGAPYQGVSVNDCIHNAKLAARRISELMES